MSTYLEDTTLGYADTQRSIGQAMTENRQPKPSDKVFRPRRIKALRLKRVLGVPGLFSAGYGDVGASIYYGLGIVAIVALGATPIALAVAGLIYVFNALT